MHDGHSIVLAEHKEMGRITDCSCGNIHINIGPVTINLKPEAFEQVTTMMQAAYCNHIQLRRQREAGQADNGRDLTGSKVIPFLH